MKFLLFCFLLDILFSNSDTLSPVDILRKTATRMDGVNHEFSVSMENSKKKRKKKDFKVLVNWPSEGEILRETLIQTYQDDKKKFHLICLWILKIIQFYVFTLNNSIFLTTIKEF